MECFNTEGSFRCIESCDEGFYHAKEHSCTRVENSAGAGASARRSKLMAPAPKKRQRRSASVYYNFKSASVSANPR